MSTIPQSWLDAVYRYYPRNLWSDDPAHAETPETMRLREVQQRAREGRSRLLTLMEAIESQAPGVRVMDFSYPTYDTCYIVRANADAVDDTTKLVREVVACISFVAPVYMLYQATTEVSPSGQQQLATAPAPDPDVVPLWGAVARQIERVFGYTRVEPDIGSMIVADVQVQNVPLGEATLYDALFTPTRA
jgi:hypothetical protein